jgi:hypothetical protein
MPAPEPNSPEAKRAAEKVRNVFYVIAVANLALVVWVMWPRDNAPGAQSASKAGDTTPAPLTSAEQTALAEMESLLDLALEGYNKRDAEHFSRGFSAKSVPPVNEEFFRAVAIGVYHEEFGELTKKKRSDNETNVDPNLGMLVYEAEGKKRPKVKVSANFRREDGKLRIVQLRMDKL